MNTEAWEMLEQRARWLLAHPDQGSPQRILQGMTQVLRLWRYPSKAPLRSWSVLLPSQESRGKRALVREVAWNRPLDLRHGASSVGSLKRRHSLHPTIRIRDAETEQTELAPFLDWAAALPPSLSGPDLPRTSGEDVYGLEGFRFLTHLRLEWEGDGPPEWAPTRRGFDGFLNFLMAQLKEREVES